jgi:uncharacterized membrane protein YgcG
MKKFVGSLLFLASICLVFLPQTVFGQSFVKDDAGVLSKTTIKKINQMNQEQFQNLPGSPEYAVVTVSDLDGESIEDFTQELFDEYGFGQSEYDNGLVFVFAIEDREFRLGYGDGLTYIFSPLSEEDLIDEDTKDLLRDEEYDQAVLMASERVYDELKAADESVGLQKIYAEGQEMLAAKNAREAEESRKFMLMIFKVGVSIVGALVIGFVGVISWRKFQTKRNFGAADVIPSHIKSDPAFDQRAFYQNMSKRENYIAFNHYSNANECMNGLKMYLVKQYIPRKLNDLNRINPQTINKKIVEQALKKPQLADQFTQEYLKGRKTILDFERELVEGQNTLRTYQAQLKRQLKEELADYDLSNDILSENMYLVSQYKQEIQRLVEEEINQRFRNNDYLAMLVTKQKTYPEMVQTSSEEIKGLIDLVKNDALFTVDLHEVYKAHPELERQVDNFSRSDRDEVMNQARYEYDPRTMNQSLVYLLLFNQVTHQEQVIADTNSSNSDFGGFSGGSSSGGGISGGW